VSIDPVSPRENQPAEKPTHSQYAHARRGRAQDSPKVEDHEQPDEQPKSVDPHLVPSPGPAQIDEQARDEQGPFYRDCRRERKPQTSPDAQAAAWINTSMRALLPIFKALKLLACMTGAIDMCFYWPHS
jgi:hypothetical protein